jgi:protein translocase SecG subunit
MNLNTIITVAQIVISVLLIVLVLLQERSGGTSGVFGGSGNEGGMYQQRRGLERMMFIATIVCLTLFIATSVALLVIK